MKKLLFTLIITFAAVTADAACIKCNQTTGWWCFMSVDGTYAYCDSPTGAGCFMWGVCTGGGSDCGEHCILNIAGVRFSNDLRIASVSVTVPLAYPTPKARLQTGV
jgi:hypothetical protein